jgi:hypothetical protein
VWVHGGGAHPSLLCSSSRADHHGTFVPVHPLAPCTHPARTDFFETLDYVFYTPRTLRAHSVVDVEPVAPPPAPLPKHPNPVVPSDHVHILASFLFR